MSVLPVKALRTLVDITRLAELLNMCSQTKPGKLVKTRTWYSIYQLTHCFSLQTSDYDVIVYFCVIVTGDVIEKVQRHHDLIKAHAMR